MSDAELRHTKRRLSDVLSLTYRNLASSDVIKEQGNGRCPRDVYYCIQCIPKILNVMFRRNVEQSGVAIYVSAWASALLVLSHRAMREPLYVGRVELVSSHVFFVP